MLRGAHALPRHAACPCSASTSAASASSRRCRPTSSSPASRASSPATTACSSCRRSRSRSNGETPRRGERRRRRGRHARPDDRARAGDRRRGARRAAVRRPDLRDAAGLDRLQPLERRAGARLGPRRDGGHVRRAALAPRAAARRRPRHRPRGHEPLGRRRRRRCSSTATGRRAAAGREARMHLGPARSLLATLPEQTFFRRYGAVFGTPSSAGARPRTAAKSRKVGTKPSQSRDGRRYRRPRGRWGCGPTLGGGARRRRVPNGQSKQSAAAVRLTRVLRRLRIENLVLIREAELELDAGLNAITGETGAGQDDPLERDRAAARRARRRGGDRRRRGGEAYVEAEFDLPDDDALGALAELRPEGEEALVARAADLRRRAHARVRVGAERRARGRRRGRRGRCSR